MPPFPSACKSELDVLPAQRPSRELTPSQRGELELAKSRAERAASGRTKQQPHGGGGKRARGGGGRYHEASLPNSDDDDNDGEQSDGELELSKLSPEEQERLLSARLASGGAGDKDARRLKRLLRNRVSAQQARERKKQYVSSLEDQIREQQAHIGLLEGRVEAVEAQNEALRNIVRTMRGFTDAPPAAPAAAAAANGAVPGAAGRANGPPPAGGGAGGAGRSVGAARESRRAAASEAAAAALQAEAAAAAAALQQVGAQVVPDQGPHGGLGGPDGALPLDEPQQQQQVPLRQLPQDRHSRGHLLSGPGPRHSPLAEQQLLLQQARSPPLDGGQAAQWLGGGGAGMGFGGIGGAAAAAAAAQRPPGHSSDGSGGAGAAAGPSHGLWGQLPHSLHSVGPQSQPQLLPMHPGVPPALECGDVLGDAGVVPPSFAVSDLMPEY
ncbi:Transcription factor HY5 [Tetrabaena socialis]|uniref:Transcription factor HY5 n=1 Tax=Tetrabaena socialis TaxID=47790 RepID=A0A2J8A5L4_9CHLO|nr:Transcription factor HY5 [Tetrabaena socialis]|eukprot:PNH07814.1 Transcription factor HY5 [Tetrabaena socialis]